MKKEEITDRRYPIGKFEYGQKYKIEDTRKHIRYLSRFPKELKKMVKKLDHDELDTPYRKGGWTVRQVIHHLADSHVNAYIRTKLAVTEQTPIIKPYEEQLWAETEDGKRGSVKMSLKLISALHRRWIEFLESLSEDDLERGYFHPGSGRVMLMQEVIALYVWHSQHHLAHIRLVANGETEKTEKAEKAAKPAKFEKVKADKAKPAEDEAPAAKRGNISTSRSNIKRASTAPAAAPAEGKRVRRTKEQLAAAKAAEAAAKEAKAAEKAAAQAAAAAEKAAKPPVDRKAIMAKARAARAANKAVAEAPAAAPKAAAKSAPTVESAKRVRRTKEQIAADKAAEAAAKADKPPVDRAAILAKARAAKKANLAAASTAEAHGEATAPTPPTAKKASAKAAKPVQAAEGGKRVRRTQEQIAADKAAAAEAKAAAKLEKKAAAKAAKKSGDAPKRAGMSAEHMARIRQARMDKRAADIAAGLIPPPKPKPVKDPNAPKLDRVAILEKARAARMANIAAKKAEANKA